MIYGIDRGDSPPTVVCPKTRQADFQNWWAAGGKHRKIYRMPKGWRRPLKVTSEVLAAAIEKDGAEILPEGGP